MIRRQFFAGAVCAAALTLVACGESRPSGNKDGGNKDGSAGCIGTECGTEDGGNTPTDGGNTPNDGGNTGADAGVKNLTLRAVRGLTFSNYEHVKVEDLVIHTIDDSFIGNPQPDGGSARCTGKAGSAFWVVDPNDPTIGLEVIKDCEDLPTDYTPTVGDVVTIDGWFQSRSKFDNPDGYRPVLRNEFAKFPKCNGQPCPGKLTVTKTGTAAVPPPNVADAGFSSVGADGGGRPSSLFSGTRVFVPGPLQLTNARPEALKRISAIPGDDRYYGFEVTGRILVNNYKTFGTTRDGGSERCDWQAEAVDGGQVSFPDGISGVWDTYTFAKCEDGGVDLQNCFKPSAGGQVPGAGVTYTYVLYPQSCLDFDGGTVTR